MLGLILVLFCTINIFASCQLTIMTWSMKYRWRLIMMTFISGLFIAISYICFQDKILWMSAFLWSPRQVLSSFFSIEYLRYRFCSSMIDFIDRIKKNFMFYLFFATLRPWLSFHSCKDKQVAIYGVAY